MLNRPMIYYTRKGIIQPPSIRKAVTEITENWCFLGNCYIFRQRSFFVIQRAGGGQIHTRDHPYVMCVILEQETEYTQEIRFVKSKI